MNPSPDLSAEPGPASPRLRRAWLSELRFLIIAYLITVVVASLFIAACGPGCCYVFFSIIAGVSGVLMLRRAFTTRCLCLCVLLLSLLGMGHEKAVRDTWGQRMLRLRIQDLQQQLEKAQTKPLHTTSAP